VTFLITVTLNRNMITTIGCLFSSVIANGCCWPLSTNPPISPFSFAHCAPDWELWLWDQWFSLVNLTSNRPLILATQDINIIGLVGESKFLLVSPVLVDPGICWILLARQKSIYGILMTSWVEILHAFMMLPRPTVTSIFSQMSNFPLPTKPPVTPFYNHNHDYHTQFP
jgi:hypothetical protein